MRYRIGAIDYVSLADARKKVSELNVEADNGINPQAAKATKRIAGVTLGDIFPRFLDHKRTKGRKGKKLSEKTLYDYQKQYDRHLIPWRTSSLDTIEKKDVVALHMKIGKSKPVRAKKRSNSESQNDKGMEPTANRILSLIGSIYSYAIDVEHYKGQNPASRVEKFEETSRDRFLSFEEIQRFMAALREEPNETFRDYFLMSMLVGQRRENVMSMRWDAIDFDRGIWTIPRIKGGKPHLVPLPERAIQLLQHRHSES